jgi:hypothetical protein
VNYSNNNNVVPFRRLSRPIAIIGGRDWSGAAFETLTGAIVMERHRRGELDPAIVAALLLGVGLEVPR